MPPLPRKILAVHAPWTAVASVLGIPLPGNALPMVVGCPICNGTRLHVYRDTIKGCEYHYCFDCKSKGDTIQLLARAWEMSEETALIKFSRLRPVADNATMLDEITAYTERHLDYQASVDQLWTHAQQFPTRSPTPAVVHLLHRFKLHVDATSDRWKHAGVQLLGALPCKTVAGYLKPNTEYIHQHPPIFRGRHWSDVLVLPFQDLPNRICALFMVGRSGSDASDRVMLPLRLRLNKLASADVGLYGLPSVLDNPSTEGVVFALRDPLLVARLQFRHLNSATRLLPIVAWHDSAVGRTRDAWSVIQDRRIIFWAWKLDAATLTQAIRANGLITVAGPEQPTEGHIDHYVREYAPRELLRRLAKHARAWRVVLRDWVDDNTDGVVEDFLTRAGQHGIDVRWLVEQLPSDAQARLHGFIFPQDQETTVVDDWRIRETVDGWSVYSAPRKRWELVFNAILRIDRIDEDFVCHGRLIYQGKEVPLTIARHRFDGSHLREHLEELLIKSRLGLLAIKDGWAARLFRIATAIHKPVLGGPSRSAKTTTQ
jgi:hypothetical protein